MKQWKESGQKAAEFASGQPYKASTLVWWSTELRRRAQGRVGQAMPRGVRNKIPLARVELFGCGGATKSSFFDTLHPAS